MWLTMCTGHIHFYHNTKENNIILCVVIEESDLYLDIHIEYLHTSPMFSTVTSLIIYTQISSTWNA